MIEKKNITVTYFDAIKSLQQYAEFGINGDDLNTLQWYDDESVVPRPTNQEIEAEYQRLLGLVGDTEYKKELSNDNSKKPVNQKILKPDEVSEQVWLDFLQLRKEKRAALTATALEGIRREAVKAGLSLNDALATSCRRGWQGFEAAWMREEKQKPAAHFTPRRGEPLKQNVVTL